MDGWCIQVTTAVSGTYGSGMIGRRIQLSTQDETS
jgi:hypothetical protein